MAVSVPFTLRRRGVEMKIVTGSTASPPDPTLVRTLREAHAWTRELRAGRGIAEIAQSAGHSDAFIRTRAQLAFLSPRPPDLTLKRILRRPVPLNWEAQERLYGLGPV